MPVEISGPRGHLEANALLDLGSQVSLVTDHVASQLGITGPIETLRLGNINNTQVYPSQNVTFDIVPANTTEQPAYTVRNAQTTPRLNVSGYIMDWPQERSKWDHLRDLDLPNVRTTEVDILLGADCFSLIAPREIREGRQGAPSAVRTQLGWTVTGTLPRAGVPGGGETLSVCHTSRQDRHQDDERLATVTTETEVVLNGQPLTHELSSTRQCWRQTQTLGDHFSSRWRNECMPTLSVIMNDNALEAAGRWSELCTLSLATTGACALRNSARAVDSTLVLPPSCVPSKKPRCKYGPLGAKVFAP